MFDQSRVAAWCAQNDPRRRGVRHRTTRDHLRALGHLLDGVAGATNTVSSAVLVGNEAARALSSSAQAKQDLPTGDVNPGTSSPFVESFINAPAAGATTMLDMARISSGFDPLDPLNDGNVAAYESYVANVLQNPMFHLELTDKEDLTISERDFTALIKDIADLFVGIKEEDTNKVKDGLVKLAEAATSTKDVRQTKDLFVQNALQIDDGDVKIYIYYSTVSMLVEDNKSTTNETAYTVMRTRLRFQTELWDEFTASAVAGHHFKDLSDWLDGNTTRPGDVKTQGLCFTA